MFIEKLFYVFDLTLAITAFLSLCLSKYYSSTLNFAVGFLTGFSLMIGYWWDSCIDVLLFNY